MMVSRELKLPVAALVLGFMADLSQLATGFPVNLPVWQEELTIFGLIFKPMQCKPGVLEHMYVEERFGH